MSRRRKDDELLEFSMALRAVARSVAKEHKPEEVQKTPQRLEWERQRELAAAKSWPFAPDYPWTTATRVGKRVKEAWHRSMDGRPFRERVSLKTWVRTEGGIYGYCQRWARTKGMMMSVVIGFMLCAGAAWAQERPRRPPEVLLREARVAEEYYAARRHAQQMGLRQEPGRDLITAKESRIADAVAIRIATRLDRAITDICEVSLKIESSRQLIPRDDLSTLCGRTGLRGLIYLAGKHLPDGWVSDVAVIVCRSPTADEVLDYSRSWLAVIASELGAFKSMKVGDIVPLDEATRLGSYVLEGVSNWADLRARNSNGPKSYFYSWLGASADFGATWFAYAGTLPRGLESVTISDAVSFLTMYEWPL